MTYEMLARYMLSRSIIYIQIIIQKNTKFEFIDPIEPIESIESIESIELLESIKSIKAIVNSL